jgi:serine/threonine-protein kinase HipA
MTSKNCYVYIQLPGSLQVVTCGRFERETLETGGAVGRFVYGRRYRALPEAVPLDPYGLPIIDEAAETTQLPGVIGALRDAGPDKWGRLLIERATGRSDLDELDYLQHGPEDRVGALGFGIGEDPPPPASKSNPIVQLADLLEAVRRVEAGEDSAQLPAPLRALVDPGTSLGGARPKAVVEDADGLWIAKFPSRRDRWNNAIVEGAMAALAIRSGINAVPPRLESIGGETILLLKRFDREKVTEGYLRYRVLSGLTALAADEPPDISRWSYLLLADELQRRSERPADDKVELFRRMVFNALISNDDDHPRNQAIVAPRTSWNLAPAYDLTPSPSYSLERNLALVAGKYGRAARRDNILSAISRFGMTEAEGAAIVDAMKVTVAGGWEAEIRGLGGTQKDCDAVRTAFTYEGFEYPSIQRGP